jgi:hypothetical protein
VTTTPARIAATNIAKLLIAKNTKMPPCGACEVTPVARMIAPVTALPIALAGMTRSGSAAAKGMAPLGDERCPEQPGRLAVLALHGGEAAAGEHGRRERHRERRDHATRHDGGHDLPRRLVVDAAGTEARDREGVGDLVDGSAEVEAHHGPEDEAEHDGGCPGEPTEEVIERHGEGRDGSAEQDDHEAGGDDRGEERDDDDGHEAAEPRRRVEPPDREGDGASEETADDTAEEAGAHEDGDGTRREPGGDTRPVGDRVGDVAGEGRHEEAHGGVADAEGGRRRGRRGARLREGSTGCSRRRRRPRHP